MAIECHGFDMHTLSRRSRVRAVVIECYTGHGECLAFQVDALERAGFSVEVWTRPRLHWHSESKLVRHIILKPAALLWLLAAWRLWRSPPAIVSINTATGPMVRNILLLIHLLRIPTVGIFHDLAKLRSHRSTRIIARLVGARMVLAQHLAQAGEKIIGLPVEFAHMISGPVLAEYSPQSQTLIVVPGSFIPGKRDNDALLALAQDNRLDSRIRFVLLGRFPVTAEAEAWWQRCIDARVQERFIRFHVFVEQTDFDRILSTSAAILPLIHPVCSDYQRFYADKISGAVNLALGFHLPILLSADLARVWSFGPAVVPYDGQDALLSATNRLVDPLYQERMRKAIAASSEASRPVQHARYLRMCERAIYHAR